MRVLFKKEALETIFSRHMKLRLNPQMKSMNLIMSVYEISYSSKIVNSIFSLIFSKFNSVFEHEKKLAICN